MNDTRVERKILRTAEELIEYAMLHGDPRYAICEIADDEHPHQFLLEDEWMLSNDIDALMTALLQWEKRQCRLVYTPPGEHTESPARGSWKIIGLSDCFQRAADALPVTARFVNSPPDEVRRLFFLHVISNPLGYGLCSMQYILEAGEAYVDVDSWDMAFEKAKAFYGVTETRQ